MNNLTVFNNSEFGQVRTVLIDNEPWFVGKDIAEALGYSNTKDAIKTHVDDEDKIMGSQNATPYITDNMGRKQFPTFINESGLYSLILSSKLPTAKKFKRWVTSEVLPTLRKTGTYNMHTPVAETDKLIKCAEIMAGCLSGNRQYVLNIIRHIVPDIDSSNLQQNVTEELTAQALPESRQSYKKPFNHNQFNNYLIEHHIKHYWLEIELGCSSTTIHKWVYGLSKPTEYHRIKLCEVLNPPIGYFDNSRRVRRIQQ